MSIAVSAVVRPSVCLRCLLAGFAALLLASVPLLLGLIGGRAYALAWPAALCCVLAAAALLRAAWRLNAVKAWRLDISPAGQLRLTVYKTMRAAEQGAAMAAELATTADTADAAERGDMDGRLVALSAASTCWPGLLCLCWRGADGRTGALIAWPGNVADGRFRALALACRAIVVQHKAVA